MKAELMREKMRLMKEEAIRKIEEEHRRKKEKEDRERGLAEAKREAFERAKGERIRTIEDRADKENAEREKHLAVEAAKQGKKKEMMEVMKERKTKEVEGNLRESKVKEDKMTTAREMEMIKEQKKRELINEKIKAKERELIEKALKKGGSSTARVDTKDQKNLDLEKLKREKMNEMMTRAKESKIKHYEESEAQNPLISKSSKPKTKAQPSQIDMAALKRDLLAKARAAKMKELEARHAKEREMLRRKGAAPDEVKKLEKRIEKEKKEEMAIADLEVEQQMANNRPEDLVVDYTETAVEKKKPSFTVVRKPDQDKMANSMVELGNNPSPPKLIPAPKSYEQGGQGVNRLATVSTEEASIGKYKNKFDPNQKNRMKIIDFDQNPEGGPVRIPQGYKFTHEEFKNSK